MKIIYLLFRNLKYEMGEILMKLSVGIITFNEENRIGKTLDSVKEIANEIIIVDSESTDKTVEIARACTWATTTTPPLHRRAAANSSRTTHRASAT